MDFYHIHWVIVFISAIHQILTNFPTIFTFRLSLHLLKKKKERETYNNVSYAIIVNITKLSYSYLYSYIVYGPHCS